MAKMKTLIVVFVATAVTVVAGSLFTRQQVAASEPSFPNVISCAAVGPNLFCCGQPGLDGPRIVCR
jgi:hypothetical protein